MRGTRAKSLRKEVAKLVTTFVIAIDKFKNFYRNLKRNYKKGVR